MNTDPCPGKAAFAFQYPSHFFPPSAMSQRLSCCYPNGLGGHKPSCWESGTPANSSFLPHLSHSTRFTLSWYFPMDPKGHPHLPLTIEFFQIWPACPHIWGLNSSVPEGFSYSFSLFYCICQIPHITMSRVVIENVYLSSSWLQRKYVPKIYCRFLVETA